MKDKIIELKNVGVYYSPFKRLFNRTKKQALKDISFSLFRGETLGVLGRNGAGKSTLLKLLAGVIEPDIGQIVKANGLTVSLLALQAGFDNELSGRDNIYLSGLLLGFDEKTVKEEFNSIIEFAEIEDIELPLKAYSTGMRARLGFSIAYKLQPDVLLIDEVLGVGDAHFKEKSINAMKSKLRSEQTVVLVSHHGPTIQNLCKRAVWIEDGVVHMGGNAQQVVKAYEEYIKG